MGDEKHLFYYQPNHQTICILKLEDNYINIYRESDNMFYGTYTDVTNALRCLKDMYKVTIIGDFTQSGKNIYTTLMESVK